MIYAPLRKFVRRARITFSLQPDAHDMLCFALFFCDIANISLADPSLFFLLSFMFDSSCFKVRAFLSVSVSSVFLQYIKQNRKSLSMSSVALLLHVFQLFKPVPCPFPCE